MIMFFFNSDFAQICWNNYEVLWAEIPREEQSIVLLQHEHQIALRFYDYIRLHRNDKIRIQDFIDIGISPESVLILFMLVYLKQPGSIRIFVDSDTEYLVYEGS